MTGGLGIKKGGGGQMVGGAASAVAFSIVANECHKLIRLLRYAASVGRHYMTIRFGGSAFRVGCLPLHDHAHIHVPPMLSSDSCRKLA